MPEQAVDTGLGGKPLQQVSTSFHQREQEDTMDLNILIGLRLVHVFAGVFWAGTAFMLAGFLEPAVQAAGPDGSKFMQRLMQGTPFALVMNLSAALATLTGLALFWWASGGMQPGWLLSQTGVSLAVGSAAGILAVIVGIGVSGPTAHRLAALSQQMQVADGPGAGAVLGELRALQQRLSRAGQLGALLLAITVTGMAVARYI
jgi:uncharacterized membrane protein